MTTYDEDYFLDYYGQCKLDPCLCLPSIKNENARFGGAWVGRQCPDWVSAGAKNMEELLEIAIQGVCDGKGSKVSGSR